MIYKTIAMTLLWVGCCLGQLTTPNGRITAIIPDSTVANETTSWGSAFGTPIESRRDDGAGPTLAQVRLSAHGLSGRQLPPLRYVTLARSLGIEPSADEAEMLTVLNSLGIKVYDFDKVDNYLYRQCLRKGSRYRWVWKPVNGKFLTFVKESHQAWVERPKVGLIADNLYPNTVPIQALEVMESVLTRMPDAKFMVTDAAIVDPFLAVTSEHLLQAGKIWIIAQWDEPGFDAEPESPLPSIEFDPVSMPKEISKLVREFSDNIPDPMAGRVLYSGGGTQQIPSFARVETANIVSRTNGQ